MIASILFAAILFLWICYPSEAYVGIGFSSPSPRIIAMGGAPVCTTGFRSLQSTGGGNIITTGTGDNDVIDPGETVELTLFITNCGSEMVTAVSGSLASSSEIIIKSGTQSFGSIAPGMLASNNNKFIFSVPNSFAETEIQFNLKISGRVDGGQYLDNMEFRVPVGTNLLAPPGANVREITDFGFFGIYSIDDDEDSDNLGNGNGFLDTGDKNVTLNVYAANATYNSFFGTCTLVINFKHLSVNENPSRTRVISPNSYDVIRYKLLVTDPPLSDVKIPVTLELKANDNGAIRRKTIEIPYKYVPSQITRKTTSGQAELKNFVLASKIISPFNGKTAGSAQFSFELTNSADIFIDVTNAGGEVVDNVSCERLAPKGKKEFCWQTYDKNNRVVFDGQYSIDIKVDDHIGAPIKKSVKVIVDHAPQDFLHLLPTTEVVSATKEYKLSWSSAFLYSSAWNHLQEYQIWGKRIDKDEAAFNLLKSGINPRRTSCIVKFPADGTWAVKIRAIDAEGNWRESDGSNSAGFTGESNRILRVIIDTTPPGRFSILQPHNEETFDSHNVLIKWNSAQDENLDYYEVTVKTNIKRYAAPSIYHQEIPASASREVYLKDLDKGEYYIYITAFDKAGNYRKNDGKAGMAKTKKERYKISKEVCSIFKVKNRIPTPYDGLEIPPDETLNALSSEALAQMQIANLKNIALNSKILDEGDSKIISDLYMGKRKIYAFNEAAKEMLLKISLDKGADWKLRVYALGWVSPDDPPGSFDVKVRIYNDKNEKLELRRSAFSGVASTKRPENRTKAIEVLIMGLEDEDDNIAGTAANGLEWLKATEAIDPLIKAVKESRDKYKNMLRSGWKEYENHSTDIGSRLRIAMRTLGELKARKAIPILIEVMEDLDFDHEVDADGINGFAAMALADIGDVRALPAIQKALREKKYKQLALTYDFISAAKIKLEKKKE